MIQNCEQIKTIESGSRLASGLVQFKTKDGNKLAFEKPINRVFIGRVRKWLSTTPETVLIG